MAQSSTILSLNQLCDVALNTPEVGVVNFTLLRTLIHVFIKILNLTEIKVEYRGVDSERVQSFMSQVQPVNQLLTEYSIKGSKDEVREKLEGQVVVVNAELDQPQFTVTMTTDQIESMETSIKKLKNKVKELEELPGNLKIFETMKQEGTAPILDMFQILNLQKRMDAMDITVEKLVTMIEAASKGIVADDTDNDGLEKRVKALEDIVGKRGSKGSKGSKGSLKPAKVTASKEIPEYDNAAIARLEKEILTLKEVVFGECGIAADGTVPIVSTEGQPVEIRVKSLENKNAQLLDQLNSMDSGFSRLVNQLQARIEELEKEIGQILERVHLIPSAGESVEAAHNVDIMQKQLTSLEADFEHVLENLKKLTDERAAKEHAVDVLIEQIELLKTVKADREDLEDALADKADACQINRKVSYEQFDQAYGDMHKNLDEALTKIGQQEALWTQTLMNIQGEVGGKMDKNELTPLREFINNKLKALQEKFKALAAMKKEQEAAGTKSRFLRNVNCISCDKDVVMRRDIDPTMFPKPYALPPAKSMGPYLAYELDQLRRQQKCVPTNKSVNVLENALQTARSNKSPDHICNRYCGGSHTVTTPQQRVTRLGHFMEQWGPEIAPVAETHVRGTDGKMYKARDDEQLKKLAAEKPPSSHPESTAPTIFVSLEPSTTKTSLVNNKDSIIETNKASQPSLNQNGKTKTPVQRTSVKEAYAREEHENAQEEATETI